MYTHMYICTCVCCMSMSKETLAMNVIGSARSNVDASTYLYGTCPCANVHAYACMLTRVRRHGQLYM